MSDRSGRMDGQMEREAILATTETLEGILRPLLALTVSSQGIDKGMGRRKSRSCHAAASRVASQ